MVTRMVLVHLFWVQVLVGQPLRLTFGDTSEIIIDVLLKRRSVMARPRSNPVWMVKPDEFLEVVGESTTYKEVFEKFGLRNKGNSHNALRKRMREEGVDGSHLAKNWEGVAEYSRLQKKPLEEYLKKDSSANRYHLKRRLIREGVLENVCSECLQKPEWKGKPMVLVLDHINGVNNDNRLDNLRLLCPNCNSQQDTFAGRNKRG